MHAYYPTDEHEAWPSAPARRIPSVTALVAAASLAIVAGAILLARYGGLGLLGFDTYPLIATSTSLDEILAKPLMHGLYPDPFYRPLVAASFAWDRALWGLAPFGYHLTDVILFSLAALAVAALAGRLASSPTVAPLAAIVAFLVHPTHVEVLPVPARRGESLCCLFLALSLLLELSPRVRGTLRSWLPATATLLAIASKETGFVAVPLVFLAVLIYCGDAWPVRLQRALMATAPHALAAAVMIAARWAVLGGLGGHREVSLVEFGRGTFVTLFTVAGWLVAPQPVMVSTSAVALLGGLVLALAGAAWVWAGREPTAGLPGMGWTARGLAVAMVWIVLLDLIYAAAGWIDTWYALLPVAGWALMVGVLAASCGRLFRSNDRPVRLVAVPAAVMLAALVAWQGAYSPLVRSYVEWEMASELAGKFLDETVARIDRASAGQTVEAAPMPIWVRPRGGRPTVFGAAVFADYTVQAWADLTRPERRVVVARSADPGLGPGPDQILLQIPQRIELE
jgi:hypothetical protein